MSCLFLLSVALDSIIHPLTKKAVTNVTALICANEL